MEQGFINTFLQNIRNDKIGKPLTRELRLKMCKFVSFIMLIVSGFKVNDHIYITQDGWLLKWAELVSESKNLNDFPIWLQYFIKVLFQIINKTGRY